MTNNSSHYIRSSKHSFNQGNQGKQEDLAEFILEYRRIAKIYLDYIWDHEHEFSQKDKTYHFDNKINLQLPLFLSTVELNKTLNIETWLSARALKCCITQVLSVVRGVVKKQSKRQYIINKMRAESRKVPKRLRKRARQRPSKPEVEKINPELNSVCADLEEFPESTFDAFLQIRSYDTRTRGKVIRVPVKFTKVSNKWKKQGEILSSFHVCENHVEIRYKITQKNKKKVSKSSTVGADQGVKTVLTLGDKQATPDSDKHGHSLDSIMKKMCSKKKGSKGMSKAQNHRTNFINWAINQLNFNILSKLIYEDVRHIRYKKKLGRYLSHWPHKQIKYKTQCKCEEEEVLLTSQSSTYMSQRCSSCGLVLKANRRGKRFSCKNCDYAADSDFNAAVNHQHDLPRVTVALRKARFNLKGFFWNTFGFFDRSGEEITVSLC